MSTGMLIGYQILCAALAGFGVLPPLRILSMFPVREEFHAIYGAIAFAEGIGSAIGLAAGQSESLNSLKLGLRRADVQAATIFKSGVQVDREWKGFVIYDPSLSRTYFISAGAACLAFVLTTTLLMVTTYRARRRARGERNRTRENPTR